MKHTHKLFRVPQEGRKIRTNPGEQQGGQSSCNVQPTIVTTFTTVGIVQGKVISQEKIHRTIVKK